MNAIASSLVLALITVGVGAIDAADAQVTPDGSLSSPTVLLSAPGNPVVVIGGGTSRGTSLFHSFSQFSVPNPGGAIFANPSTIQTIFARVTGNTSSSINGLLQTQGSASLFLMNPNGIIFGPKALLDVKGSLIATTAHQIQFGTQGFSAVTRNDAPLLTVNVPIGLQLSPTSGSITVNSTGHTLTTTSITGLTPVIATSRPGLQLRPNNTIALLGNTVTLDNGVVGAAQGRIEVGSVRDGLVQIEKTGTNWTLGYAGISDFSAVTMKGRSLLDVGGVNAGAIQIQGRDIKILDGSNVLSQNIGPIAGGLIRVNASETLAITDTTADGKIRGGIESETFGRGASSKIIVTAPKITIATGGGIFNKSFGRGIGGDVEINASDRLDLLGFAPLNPVLSSSLGTVTVGTANSGNLLVNAKTINLYQGGSLNAITFGSGASGLLTVNADTIVMGGGLTPLTAPSAIIVNTFGPGQSGSLTVNTRTLDIVKGGAIAGTAYTLGNAGNVTVNASESIFINGYVDPNNQLIGGSINSSVLIPEGPLQQLLNSTATPIANAGTVVINTPRLQIQNGGFVSARNQGNGAGGDVKIKTQETSLDSGRISVLTASGRGGSITLQTQDLSLANNSTINAIVNDGNAGEIAIDAGKKIRLDASNIVGNTTGKGNGALIKIMTPELDLRNRSQISSTSLKSGNAGNIKILNSDRISLDNYSEITNRSNGTGRGGTIELSSRSLSLNHNSQLNASTEASDGGNLILNVMDLVRLDDRSLLNAEAGGLGNGGNITLNTGFVVGFGDSDIIANAVRGNGGKVTITTQGIFGLAYRPQRTLDNDITASSEFGINGTVKLNMLNISPTNALNVLPSDVAQSSQLGDRCGAAKVSSFVATGRGGIPQNPMQKGRTDRPWTDLRSPFREGSAEAASTPARQVTDMVQPIVEATAIQLDKTGAISLVSANPIANQSSATCGIEPR
jgi:filamentous hemagglutinin family protein